MLHVASVCPVLKQFAWEVKIDYRNSGETLGWWVTAAALQTLKDRCPLLETLPTLQLWGEFREPVKCRHPTSESDIVGIFSVLRGWHTLKRVQMIAAPLPMTVLTQAMQFDHECAADTAAVRRELVRLAALCGSNRAIIARAPPASTSMGASPASAFVRTSPPSTSDQPPVGSAQPAGGERVQSGIGHTSVGSSSASTPAASAFTSTSTADGARSLDGALELVVRLLHSCEEVGRLVVGQITGFEGRLFIEGGWFSGDQYEDKYQAMVQPLFDKRKALPRDQQLKWEPLFLDNKCVEMIMWNHEV